MNQGLIIKICSLLFYRYKHPGFVPDHIKTFFKVLINDIVNQFFLNIFLTSFGFTFT